MAKKDMTPQEWGLRLISRCSEHKPYMKTTLEMIEKADLSVADQYGVTALMACASKHHHEIARLLIEKNVDLDARTPVQLTSALSWGTRHNADETVLAIIAAGADVDIRTHEGETPLHIAAGNGNTVITKALIEAGADINAQDMHGRTPLYHVATSGHAPANVTACAQLLLQAWADMDLPSNKGETPETRILKNATDGVLRYPDIAAAFDAERTRRSNAVVEKALSGRTVPATGRMSKPRPKTGG